MTKTISTIATDVILADLARFWCSPQRFQSGRVPGRIAGSRHDQAVPKGISNPYWEIVRQIPTEEYFPGERPEPNPYFYASREPLRLVSDRHALCTTYSWAIPSPGAITWITGRLKGRGIVEPGAGGGYWAWQLRQAGADVVACEPEDPADNKFVTGRPWSPVLRDDHGVTARHPDRAMLLCWPNYSEPWAAWSLSAYKGDRLFYIGESKGGCCADDEFFSLLDAEWEETGDCSRHISYRGIHDRLTEYRRKAR